MMTLQLIHILLLIVLVGVALICAAWQKRRQRVRSVARGLLISYATILLLLLLGEVYFRYAYADSGWGFTLAHRNWEQRYWRTNALGFRDREWTPEDWAGKTTILVTGDSFAAGWGVDNPADRFSDVLAAHLGADYAVINIAVPGASTRKALDLLQDYPLKAPDVVILQYFLNDIEDAAASISRFWSQDWQPAPPFVDESYLLNFIYWRLAPSFRKIDTSFNQSYWEWEYGSYDDAQVWNIHRREIDALIDHVEAAGARLIVVIFPNLEDPVGSIAYVDRVAQAFEERGQGEILRLYDDVAAWPRAEVIVSPRDPHPSAAFHRHVGDRLYQEFFAVPGGAPQDTR